ncbi:MAG TPA: crosslink repair DNA glycosylase YcaQ family protein [Pyrinomonadaceae bacterium]|nr:crosslink repair DNA glycosylase YcaQ family protein [Pyrinomonadaceae bacterium]
MSGEQARRLMVAAQGLDRRPGGPATKADVLAAVRRMGALQIDTIQVVARSPFLVLWSRLGDYEPRWLEELLAEGEVFEYWSHEACFLPSEDYPLYRRRMLDLTSHGWHYSHAWVERHRLEVEGLLAHVRERGAVRSSDFARGEGRGGGWWDWKTEKRALEMLFTAGELMIARRHNFQRVYDLRERVRPGWDDSRLPEPAEVERTLALRAIRALGVTTARWVADYFRTDKRQTARVVESLAGDGLLLAAKVEGWKGAAFVHTDHAEALGSAAADRLRPELTTPLSPFDPLVWDRARAREAFNFDYKLECYTPAPKRRYGYFVLPVLRRGELVARFDAKAHRRERVFEVKSFYVEPGVAVDESFAADVGAAVAECARWHGTPRVRIGQTHPAKARALLRAALKG